MNGRTPTLRHASLVALLLALATGPGYAADIEWNNDAGGSWNDPANWSPEQVPTFEDRALITLAGTYTVEVSPTDAVSIAELVVGGPGTTPTLLLAPGANVSVEGSIEIRSGAVLRLEGESGLSAVGAAVIAGRVEGDGASFGCGEGFRNTGVIEIAAMSLSGRVANDGLLHTVGMCGFDTVENGPGARFEVRTGPGLVPGATMDSLVNRGHASFGPSVQVIAGTWMANEPGGVIALEASTIANSETFRNAGVWRMAPGAQLTGVNFEQLASGEYAPEYAGGGVIFSVTCLFVTLDGTLAPVFDAAFSPPPSNLPLIFAQAVTGQFAITSQAGTHGIAIEAAYLGSVFVRVLGPGIAITPPAGGDAGPVSTLISGCDLASVTEARLTRAGQSAIVADPLSRDADTQTIYATFDLTGRALGAWTLELEGPGGTQSAPNAFMIAPTVVFRQPIRVDWLGPRLMRFGSNAEWSLAIMNPNDTDEHGAVEITVPAGLGWELTAQRPGEARTIGAAGKYDLATSLVVPNVLARPGLTISAVRVRLTLPAGFPLGSGSLQARWFQP